MKLAKCECLREYCSFKFEMHPGPHTLCPHCGFPYVKWVNYDEDFARKPDHERSKEA